MIKIMADSTCDLSREMLDKYDIEMAPLTVALDNKVYRDRIDISPDEFYLLMGKASRPPTTAAPSPSEYIAIFEKAVRDGYSDILCICMSSGTSAAYATAVIAKQQFREENPDSQTKIHLVDSLGMSHGSGWLILKSARLREAGASFQQLIDFNESYKLKVKHFLSVDDLDHLLRSGRLSNGGAFLGKLLNIKPVMTMKNGRGAIVARLRGRRKVLEYYVREFLHRADQEITDFIIIGYTTDISVAQELKSKLAREASFAGDILIMQMGAAVGTHVGPGGISMFFAEENQKAPHRLYKDIFARIG